MREARTLPWNCELISGSTLTIVRAIGSPVEGNPMGLTQEVAHYVAKTRYRDIPPEIIRAARGFVLDGLGVALAGHRRRP
jgi:hypothetical protein